MKAKRSSVHNGRKLFYAALVIAGLILLGVWFSPHTQNMRNILGISQFRPRRSLPPNDYARGLIYDGLEVDTDGSCKGLLKVKGKYRAGERVLCTHGPDPGPEGVDMRKQQIPLIKNTLGATSEQVLGTQTYKVTCDGDGVTGNRVQLMVVHTSDVLDNFASTSTLLYGNAMAIDIYMRGSASETGGERSVRWVHDSTCAPTALNATVPAVPLPNLQTFAHIIDELKLQGYNRPDRKYLIFVDGQNPGCGIGTGWGDDSLSPTNWNNVGPSFALLGPFCHALPFAEHELMHTLGAVQRSAPNSTFRQYSQYPDDPRTWHCSDEYDDLCYEDVLGVTVLTYPCPSFRPVTVQGVPQLMTGNYMLDCNHNDYFSTNPLDPKYLPSSLYLLDYWNTANNQFLIGANGPAPTPTPTPTPTPVPDKTPPTVKIDTPSNGETVGLNTNVLIAATATDNVAVKIVSFYINGVLNCDYPNPTPPWTCNWVPLKKSTWYTIKAVAKDTSGNTATTSIKVKSSSK